MFYNQSYKDKTKKQLVEIGVEHVKRFMNLNRVPFPTFYLFPDSNPYGYCGLCDFKRRAIKIHVPDVANVSFNPSPGGRQWSYPGYKIDRTGIGVVAHEAGHWVDSYFRIHKNFPKGERITGYEPNVYEAVAESMRLFILNPCLLYLIAPKRCEHILNCGVKPLVDDDWDTVLQYAPNEYFRIIRKNYGG